MQAESDMERLGLLGLLEKAYVEGKSIDGITRIILSRKGLITSHEPWSLTDAGVSRLTELRTWRVQEIESVALDLPQNRSGAAVAE